MKMNLNEEHKQYAFEAYCKAVLRNKARTIHKRLNRQAGREVLFSDIAPELLDSIATSDAYCLSEPVILETLEHSIPLENRELADALTGLVPKYREVIILSYFMEQTDPEIAQKLNVPVSTVNDRKKSALQRLRDRMRNDE